VLASDAIEALDLRAAEVAVPVLEVVQAATVLMMVDVDLAVAFTAAQACGPELVRHGV